jgi:DnaJ-class molecular chaperone with C-terminal Zn finger domain
MTPEAAAAILGVGVSATRAEINAGYLLRARLTHPDRFAGAPAGDIAAASREFVRVRAARDVLWASPPPETADAPASVKAGAAVSRRLRARGRFDDAAPLREAQVWIA